MTDHRDAPVTSGPTPLDLVLAGDLGATRSRILLAPVDPSAAHLMAEPLLGPGANLRSSGPDALDSLVETVRGALAAGGEGAASRVGAVVLGIAGAGPARHQEVERAVREALAPLGIPPQRVLVCDDLRTAFLSADVGSGDGGEDGILLLAGTGAVAVRYAGGVAVERCDGMGWLLGDIGSAVWLGTQVLRAVASDIDRRGPRTALTDRVGDLLDLDLRDGLVPPSPTGDPRQDLIRAIDGLSPAQLGRFAPLPATAPGDEVAREILDTASRHFARTVRRLDPEAELPVVLAGSVLATPGPLHEHLVSWLESVGHPVAVVADGMPGALRLAREHARALAGER
ncbi:N-acetylglucosamine kinase [Brachybacterium sp. JHP9]|uniref:N-acetylglucosamine kinase n=1 Tax=Brachybacterium equifaecis TaxID=2910770 RepID=A0ABT0QXF3_9MICO|nr:BadF/BadG/BcrA/BcrD ATPase family protein [Brachybacterium equifaecis]MCL6422367.1 N-acetylglucosamine kinase [Brachybacterium equifaecis]